MVKASVNTASKRVLLVDDSPVNQRLFSGLLQQKGYVLTVAANGQQALHQMEEQGFDVVLMDVQMPIMDGLTATRIIRKRESLTKKHTPIIGVTDGMDRQSCLDAGMDDYLAKPVPPQSLHEKLDMLLGDSLN